ncbi:guanine deaminase [Lactarius sanguifluus]|nr:guanine deaminase [Lactarius sanguifluus]
MSPVVFYGPLVNPKSTSSLLLLPNSLLAVAANGNIDWIEHNVHPSSVQDVLTRHGSLDTSTRFVDTHTHAPQVPNIGSGQQYELLDWLKEVTFPMEARFADADFAHRAYTKIVERIINSGQATNSKARRPLVATMGTIHLEATKKLAEIVNSYGQRAFVGKCNMDHNSLSDYVEPSVSSSIDDTNALISHIRSLPFPRLVEPVLTPRFAMSCSRSLMTQLGAIASADPSLRIQTHISENQEEVRQTLELFPEATSYADVYDRHGLLGPRTILAHAIHLGEDEIALLKERDAGVGLGTDVSGGFSPSILTAIQHASIASKIVAIQHPCRTLGYDLPLATLLYLATLGGARVCGLEDRIGSFAPGKAFDALVVSVRGDTGNPGLWGIDLDDALNVKHVESKELEVWLERFLFTGDDRNIRRVYVQGQWIGGAERIR